MSYPYSYLDTRKTVALLDDAKEHRMTAPMDSKTLVERAAIEAVLVSYCQGVDRREWDQVADCYHPEATDQHGEFSGSPADLVSWMRSNHDHVTYCMHTLSNVSIRFSEASPQLARVESYCVSRKIVEHAEKDPYLKASGLSGRVGRTVACRYVDTFEHRESVGWKILRRTVVHEWMRKEAAESFVDFAPSIAMSKRDRSDLLFSPVE